MEHIDDILGRVRDTLSEHHMIPAGDAPVVVMVSGGGDSVALLEALRATGSVDDTRLHVLHVDHGLRGADSRDDAAYVVDACRELGVPCAVEHVDVAAIAATEGLNIEETGRLERYRLAEELCDALCDEAGASRERGRIAVGHTRDDRIETFLMRLAQGAGSTGLTTLRPVRGRVVRPLIAVAREEARAYLAGRGREWREDATNLDTDRLRAKVRHDLLPLMRGINPRFDDALERTIAVLGDEDDLLRAMADAFAADFVERLGGGEGGIAFDRAMMATLSRPMQRRTVRSALLGAFPDASRIEFEHVERLVDGMGTDGFAHDLGYGLRAYDEYGRMVVSRAGEGPEPLAPCLLPLPGACDLGPYGRMLAEDPPADSMCANADSVVIDLPDGVETLSVGPVREGERIEPLGLGGSKKLSDVLIDAKVPKRERATVPIVREGDRVVWVAGVRMSERYRVTERTTRAVRLTWLPNARGDGTPGRGAGPRELEDGR